MKLAVFGASGRTGRLVVTQALAEGHSVRALVRDPTKLGMQSPRLELVTGDVSAAAKVDETLRGADAVISVLAPSSNAATTILSEGMRSIVAAMQRQGVRRLVASNGAGVSDAQDRPGPFDRLIKLALLLTAGNVYREMERVAEVVRTSDVDWTLVRVPMLTDGPKRGQLRVGYVGAGTGPRLTRADLADFLLRETVEARYLRQAPAISN